MSEITKETHNKKTGLGRGLGSLLGQSHGNLNDNQKATTSSIQQPTPKPTATESIPKDARIWKVGIDKVSPSQFQPRNYFEKEKLEELATSIREHGILQPIVVRASPAGGFEIVAGERRWRAAQLAGLHEVPIIIKDFGDQKTLELALIENIQREDLNPIEQAEAYQRLVTEFNLTQAQIAEKVGKERATIANLLRILALPLKTRDALAQNKITLGHAKVLLSISDPERQLHLTDLIAKKNLSVRKLERTIAKNLDIDADDELAIEEGSVKPSTNVTDRLITGLAEELQKTTGTKVNIDYQAGKGKISIHFYSDDQLTDLVDRLRNGCQK